MATVRTIHPKRAIGRVDAELWKRDPEQVAFQLAALANIRGPFEVIDSTYLEDGDCQRVTVQEVLV